MSWTVILFKMFPEVFHQDNPLSNGLLFTLFLVLPFRKEETLFEPFVLSLLYEVFICLFESDSCRLMADRTLLFITGWTVLYILLNDICDKDYEGNNFCIFPYNESTVGQWFQQDLSEDGTSERKINMLNLRKRPKSNEYPRLNEAVFPPSEAEGVEGFQVLYHGTVHEHAKSILKHRIKLRESTTDGDFSCGKGFYLTNQFEKAVSKYAFSRGSAKAAVLVFKIPNDVFEGFKSNSLDLMGEEKRKEWRDVVQNIQSTLKKEEHSFIEGPEMKRELGGRKTYKELPDTHQICILDEEMANVFDKYLDSVVFYDTSRR